MVESNQRKETIWDHRKEERKEERREKRKE